MFWELIATFLTGFMAAGVVMSLRLIIKKLPKWIVPAAAGLGMIGFQVYSEYDWFDHTKNRLPEGVVVVATHESSVFYQPWSYFIAPTTRFVAVEKIVGESGLVRQANLYFFERRMSAEHTPILVDCQNKRQSNFSKVPNWGITPMTNNIVMAVCN